MYKDLDRDTFHRLAGEALGSQGLQFPESGKLHSPYCPEMDGLHAP